MRLPSLSVVLQSLEDIDPVDSKTSSTGTCPDLRRITIVMGTPLKEHEPAEGRASSAVAVPSHPNERTVQSIIDMLPADFPLASSQLVQHNSSYDSRDADFKLANFMVELYEKNLADTFFGPYLDSVAEQKIKTKRFADWHSLFDELVHDLLLTAEDKLVYLPDANIVEHFRRLSPALRTVQTPKLCSLDLTNRHEFVRQRCRRPRPSDNEPRWREKDKVWTSDEIYQEYKGTLNPRTTLLGDPFFSRAFQQRTEAFSTGLLGSKLKVALPEPMVQVRLSMYRAYYAMDDILKNYEEREGRQTTPQDDQVEMEARERLTEAMKEMGGYECRANT